jgi:excisionase family DNA binding protein
MTKKPLYSVQEVAELLSLHPRTVRNHIREGRLEATRIGRQYRVPAEVVAALTGEPLAHDLGRRESVRRERYVEASSVVDVHAIGRDAAERVMNLLMGAANTRRPPDPPFRVQTLYDLERGRLKIMAVGAPDDMVSVYRTVQTVLDSERR